MSNYVKKLNLTSSLNFSFELYYRKRGSVSYSVRSVRSVRETDTERDGSDVTIVALKLAMSFALFLAKNLPLSFSPLE